MTYTIDDFITFCTKYEEESGFKFESEKIIETETGLEYEATFRDEYNYYIPVKLFWSNGTIDLEEPTFYSDEEEDTVPFFHWFTEEIFDSLRISKKEVA